MNTFAAMQLFPVEYSSLSATALLHLVNAYYDLQHPSSIIFLKRGFNDTYLINGGTERFIFRVYKHGWRNQKDIEAEVELLLFLKENGVAVSYPVQDTRHNFIQVIQAPEGIRYAVLFSYAEGEPVKKLSPEQAELLGTASANMHLLTKALRLESTARDYDIAGQFQYTLRQLQPVLMHHPRQLHFLQKLEQLFLQEFKMAASELVSGICHGDLQAENFHMTSEKCITFFDFDFFGKGYLVYDIGVFVWYDHKNKPPEIVQAFLKGYESKRCLSEAERRAIPWMSTLRAVFQMTVYCELSDGKHLPLWPSKQVADFIDKVEKWFNERISNKAPFL